MPGDPDSEILRIGTAEREEACRLLGDHFSDGRLTSAEYEERVATALAAHTRADIRPLFTDLPAPRPVYLLPPLEPRAYALPYAPPATELERSEKSRIVAGVLQILIPVGTGRFYTGHTSMAVAQLLVTLFTLGAGALWPLIDGILLLVNGGCDGKGRPLRD
ncbi:DUF1707 domain-containing protein [Prauserella flavalba]|uniref:Uncharacterized protein n=1 Tax=Prauserella flavalba TaxID=1477506 RepID=A0A318LGG4_9PSEU|nr:DUF1707 domain-containing protein [Prauserella flavalba]PXY26464.1 hypothetical protein BA062_23835 [Prauserella flavalba]